MLAVACFVTLVCVVNAVAETTRIKTVFDGHLVYEDVTKDLDSNTMLILVDSEDAVADFRSTANLHDFNTGYVALKSIKEKICLLKPLEEGMKDHLPSNAVEEVKGEKVLVSVKTMYWDRDPHKMSNEEVKELAGENLAEFCHEYDTYKLVPKELDLDSRALLSRERCEVSKKQNGRQLNDKRRARVKRGCGWWARCGSCLNYVDVFGGDVVDTEEKNDI